jgi:hypothetical protein
VSKAFVKESDQDDEEEFGAPPIPAGVKNYLTPEGHHRMKTELLDLIDNQRPEVVKNCVLGSLKWRSFREWGLHLWEAPITRN